MAEQYQLFGKLRPEEFASLEADILVRGVMIPVEVDPEGNILDGHHRVKIATKHKLKYKTVTRRFKTEQAKREHVIKINLCRRQLDPIRWGAAARRLLSEKGVDTGQGARNDKGTSATVAEVAKECGVSERTARDRMAKAKAYAALPAKQRKAVDAGLTTVAKAKSAIDREAKRKRLKATAEALEPDEDRLAAVILCDPPWQYDYSKSDSRKIENQYPTMTAEDLCEIDVQSVCDDDAIIFMWATSPKLTEAFGLLDAWGFNYRTCAVWDKEKIGMGYYFRQQHELLLVATIGKPGVPDPQDRPSSVFRSPRKKHSAKPECVYEFIEKAYPHHAKRELFARTKRDGWLKPWGNEA